MKVTSKTLVVAATLKNTVDGFQVPLGSPITGSNPRLKTLSSFTTTTAPFLQQTRKSLPFLSQIRSTLDENEELDAEGDDYYGAGNDGNGQDDSIVDQLSLEEQKELILRQLNIMDDDAGSDFDVQQQENDEYFRSTSKDIEDDDYYNYYDDYEVGSPQNQRFDDDDDNYYGYDDGPEDLPPRERRRRRHQRDASTSLGTTASGLAKTAIRIGGKATNVAKKTTEKAWQSLIENTFDDDWDDEENEAVPRQRRRNASNRPSRSNSRPMSRYERDRRRAASPRRQRTQQRQNVDDFTTKRPQDEQQEEEIQEQNYRMRRDPNRRASRPPRRPIENSTDEMNATDGTPPPSRRRRDETSNKRNSTGDSQEQETVEDIDNGSSAKGDSKDPSWKSILEKTSKVASKKAKAIPRKIVKKAETTAKKAKEVSYKAVSILLEDDEEEEDKGVDPVVLDAVIEDKKEERIVEAEPIPMEEWPSNAWSNTQPPPGTHNRSETARDASTFESASSRPKTRRRRQTTPQPPRRRRPRARRPQKPDSAVNHAAADKEQEQKYYYGLFQLPPAEGSFGEPNVGQETTAANEPTEPIPRRKVYSPYGNQSKRRGEDSSDYYEDMDDMYTDGVDRMGNFVADALDTFLWGREDEDGPVRNRPRRRNQRPSGRQTTGTDDDKTGSKRHKRSGHWKDHMEEQFDEFLGIHEGGKYYDRWANQESELENQQENNRKKNGTRRDPVSFARGEVGRGNRRTKSRPIWEEEDSLLSVLFGTDHDTASRNARLYRSASNLPFFGNGGSLLRVVQSLLQSVALVAGRVSQWASVRGSLPQPVIVVGLLSALLSARPGKRWQTVLFATLALRMMGELLHGYMYDDLDFEDDLSVVNHKDDLNSEFGDDDFDMDKYDGADYM
mmetsp:Transcript_21841/g.54008  ORF Transcript_21841/g.54008 Transcript_21841/m.54008 type:complete len:898 (-) Transcript_21841:102-2795(-)